MKGQNYQKKLHSWEHFRYSFIKRMKQSQCFLEVEKCTLSTGKEVSGRFESSLLGVIHILPGFLHSFNQNFIFGLAKM